MFSFCCCSNSHEQETTTPDYRKHIPDTTKVVLWDCSGADIAILENNLEAARFMAMIDSAVAFERELLTDTSYAMYQADTSEMVELNTDLLRVCLRDLDKTKLSGEPYMVSKAFDFDHLSLPACPKCEGCIRDEIAIAFLPGSCSFDIWVNNAYLFKDSTITEEVCEHATVHYEFQVRNRRIFNFRRYTDVTRYSIPEAGR